MKMNRRQFVSTSAVAAAVAVQAAAFPRAALAMGKTDVIVIGAGFSGLNTAIMLKDAGYNVTVLEASGRIGGRAFTGDHIEGRPELGANQIGPQYARVRDMANRLGVKLSKGANLNAAFSFSVDGNLIRSEDWASSKLNKTVGVERELMPTQLLGHYLIKNDPFQSNEQWLEAAASAHDVSVGEWLQRLGASPAAMRLISEGLIAPDLWSASVLDKLQGIPRNFMAFQEKVSADVKGDSFEQAAPVSARVVGGTQRLPEAMAASLGDSVHLNKAVTRIDMEGTRAEVICLDGTRYSSSFVVSAVPLTVLRRISIYPHLVDDQREAVRLMPYSNTTFIYMNVKKPFWEDDGLDASLWTDGPVNVIRQAFDYDGSRDRLVALSTGQKAAWLDQLTHKERGEYVIKQIETLRPSTVGQLEVSGIHSWGEQPFNAGCSGAFPAGNALRYAQALVKPHALLHFAGEHTKRLEVGMESAMESGERAALEIFDRS